PNRAARCGAPRIARQAGKKRASSGSIGSAVGSPPRIHAAAIRAPTALTSSRGTRGREPSARRTTSGTTRRAR
ncbi:hypothetical protein, partial [Burkholderia pseudomallei]|uniref:hypothetical protein n=1 Tax=Burkholderia pseudomallei TaxID=28450 RepID=UPI0019552933